MKRPRQLELCGGAIGGGVSGDVNRQVFAEVAKQQKDLQMSLSGNKIGPEGLKVSDILSD